MVSTRAPTKRPGALVLWCPGTLFFEFKHFFNKKYKENKQLKKVVFHVLDKQMK